MSDESEGLQGPALDQRTGLVLGQSQQDADTGLEVLNNTKSQSVSLSLHNTAVSLLTWELPRLPTYL